MPEKTFVFPLVSDLVFILLLFASQMPFNSNTEDACDFGNCNGSSIHIQSLSNKWRADNSDDDLCQIDKFDSVGESPDDFNKVNFLWFLLIRYIICSGNCS